MDAIYSVKVLNLGFIFICTETLLPEAQEFIVYIC